MSTQDTHSVDSSSFRTTTASCAETQALGACLAQLLAPQDVIILTGDLGAGKTQFTKGVAEGLGVVEPVTSPTFNIVLVHEGRLPLYHFDLYRLDEPWELDDIDYHGILEADGASLVEWGDKFPDDLPIDRVEVAIHASFGIASGNDGFGGDESARAIDVRGVGKRSRELAAQWGTAWRNSGHDVTYSGVAVWDDTGGIR